MIALGGVLSTVRRNELLFLLMYQMAVLEGGGAGIGVGGNLVHTPDCRNGILGVSVHMIRRSAMIWIFVGHDSAVGHDLRHQAIPFGLEISHSGLKSSHSR